MNYKILIPLKKKSYRDHTQEENLLFFFKKDKIYLMDNHRLSFWCFLDGIKNEDFGKYTYIHIDDHFDTGTVYCEELANKVKNNELSFYNKLDQFRNDTIAIKNKDNLRTFLCGNYLMPAIFYNFFNNKKLFFFVKQETSTYYKGDLNDNCFFNGNIPKIKHYQRKRVTDLEKILESENNIVLNIDFDYFSDFINKPQIIHQYFSVIKSKMRKIKFILVSLTTSSNNWKEQEDILKIFSDIFDLKLEIPLKISS